MSFYWFMLGTLCTWRLTHMLTAEDGPWRVMARLRQAARGDFWSSLLGCFYCLSLWVALPLGLVLGGDALERALLWPALSGAAILLQRANEPSARPTLYSEDKESGDGMLR